MTTLIVAYSTNKKKQRNFFDGLVRAAKTWVGYCGPSRTQVAVRLFQLDPEDPAALSHLLSNHPNPPHTVHAIIHKRTDDMAASLSGHHPDAAHRVTVLDHVLKGRLIPEARQRIPVISFDPLDGVWRLLDRREIALAVDRAFGKPLIADCENVTCCPHKDRRLHIRNVTVIPWTHIPLRKGLDAVRNAIHGKLNFPIIMKRRLACGTKPSHEMVVAYDMDAALSAAQTVFGAPDHDQDPSQYTHAPNSRHCSDYSDEFAMDVVAQEFITNHGGVLFKLYAIGNNIVVQPRSSIEPIGSYAEGGYYYFDSQKLNLGEPFTFDPVTGCSKSTEAVMPSRKLAAAIVSDLSRELGLSMIGVDLVYDTLTKNYHVVDINYFPGYKGVGKAYEWLLQYICNRVLERLEER